ncbi:hypothetical protein GW17_00034712 [Ensete ventricosum]|nr:hypothetical protein GW17_00034712 [Ensete ventricosum]
MCCRILFFRRLWFLFCFSFSLVNLICFVSLIGLQDCDTISVMKAGKLRLSKPNKYWVESSHKRVSDLFLFFLLVFVVYYWQQNMCRVCKIQFLALWSIVNQMLLGSPTCPVLEALGKKLSYEIAVGLNGRVWVSYYHS